MKRHENPEFDELEELLWRAEAVLDDAPEDEFFEEAEEDFEDESPVLYRNYANGYGETIRNYANGYGAGRSEPVEEVPRRAAAQPIYADYGDDFEERSADMSRRAVVKEKPAKKHKKRRRGCGCLPMLLAFVVVIAAALVLYVQPPRAADSIGARKSDTATILVCGTDADGTRTDTMMLLYLSGSDRQIGLLSLPRDTYTITSAGKAAKLNSAYGRNGTGAEGMEALLDYVKDIIGYRPDGYILVDFTLVPQIVDIMGGVDVEVPMDMELDGVTLTAGYQHLTGEQVITLLRFRKGYATADLGRVEVQRTVLKACMEQWVSVTHITDALDAISMLKSNSMSSLSTRNYLWIAKAMMLGLKNVQSDTLPGYADYRNEASYYILNKSEVAEMVNNSYNPYKVSITPEMLNIAG